MFAVFAFTNKVPIIFDWFVSSELCYYSTGFDFKICLQARKVAGPFEKRAPEHSTVK